MSSPDLIIFDCDGVLVDSEQISCGCLANALCEVGIAIDTDGVIQRFLGLSNASVVSLVEAELGHSLPEDFLTRLIQSKQVAYADRLQAISGIHQMLEELSIPVCVASSSHPDLIQHCLEITGLINYFEPHLFSAIDVQYGKPAPDLFLYAADKMGVTPDRCIVIEDSDRGVLAAKAAGMVVFGFTGASHINSVEQQQKLIIAGADMIFEEMQSLPALVRSLP